MCSCWVDWLCYLTSTHFFRKYDHINTLIGNCSLCSPYKGVSTYTNPSSWVLFIPLRLKILCVFSKIKSIHVWKRKGNNMNRAKLNVYFFCAIIYLVIAIATFFILGNSIIKYILMVVELFAFFIFIFMWNKNHSP